ncbi:flagellar biosynthesis anti-sigma factor FlgM [Legionella norrlandica]|uniref:Negative regulator of flagellin synthesis n=1 Tax=Legionella norrlandica TaxID=1498499 RepID=A0A0A2SSN3_9GAMM|nr:flagellar biosynthesis anti-sigma factor FlgM [Legionella norrlandica]KGP64145.1 flagellar biosynthesis anti-sigma factor FlgM [Legionella norrlandica]
MINAIEETLMVSRINNSISVRNTNSDCHLNTEQREAKNLIAAFDNATLSSTSKQLEALKASLQSLSEINEARILYFKAEIASGHYQIHSDKIAYKMLNQVEMA